MWGTWRSNRPHACGLQACIWSSLPCHPCHPCLPPTSPIFPPASPAPCTPHLTMPLATPNHAFSQRQSGIEGKGTSHCQNTIRSVLVESLTCHRAELCKAACRPASANPTTYPLHLAAVTWLAQKNKKRKFHMLSTSQQH